MEILYIILILLSLLWVLCVPKIERLPDDYWIVHYYIPFTKTRTYFRFRV